MDSWPKIIKLESKAHSSQFPASRAHFPTSKRYRSNSPGSLLRFLKPSNLKHLLTVPQNSLWPVQRLARTRGLWTGVALRLPPTSCYKRTLNKGNWCRTTKRAIVKLMYANNIKATIDRSSPDLNKKRGPRLEGVVSVRCRRSVCRPRR